MSGDAALREALARGLHEGAEDWLEHNQPIPSMTVPRVSWDELEDKFREAWLRRADYVLAYARTVQAATIEACVRECTLTVGRSKTIAAVRALTPELPLPPAPEGQP